MKKIDCARYGLLLCALWLLNACVRPQEKLQREIEKEESGLSLDSSPVPDKTKAQQMIELYQQYATAYPDDTLSPAYLFKAAELNLAIGQFNPAMDLFNRVQRYPNFKKVATALFLQGFIAENHLHDTEKAKAIYEKFLRLYPEHELAADVRLMLQQLSLSPEALIRMFESKQENKDTIPVAVP